MVIFGIFMFPISEHSFYLKATKSLFLARTNDDQFFRSKKTKGKIKDTHQTSEEEELKQNRTIKVGIPSSIKLFLSRQLGWLFPTRAWSQRVKMEKLYKEGSRRMNDLLDVVQMVRNIRNFKVIL